MHKPTPPYKTLLHLCFISSHKRTVINAAQNSQNPILRSESSVQETLSMASARIARFATESAPPQFVTVMRQRASKMLDTIPEEDTRDFKSDSYSSVTASSITPSVPRASFSGVAMPPKFIFQAIKARVSTFSR